MNHCHNYQKKYSRRDFLNRTTLGLGAVALGQLLNPLQSFAAPATEANGGILGGTHFAPKVKRVIYLFQSGGPSQMELFDYKPMLRKMAGQEIPDSIRGGQRVSGMTSGQKSFPVAGHFSEFKQHGKSGRWVSDLLPHIAEISDELCYIQTMSTEAINH
ncbi:MAG: DUF1501 domain-containing protein, partial [Bacteroidota bacterium]